MSREVDPLMRSIFLFRFLPGANKFHIGRVPGAAILIRWIGESQAELDSRDCSSEIFL